MVPTVSLNYCRDWNSECLQSTARLVKNATGTRWHNSHAMSCKPNLPAEILMNNQSHKQQQWNVAVQKSSRVSSTEDLTTSARSFCWPTSKFIAAQAMQCVIPWQIWALPTSSCLLLLLAAAEVLEIIQVFGAVRADCATEKSGVIMGWVYVCFGEWEYAVGWYREKCQTGFFLFHFKINGGLFC